tara:strand:+ start:158 stop:829 length:672 start_codon:yes stop_codon:yes gene_type:complete
MNWISESVKRSKTLKDHYKLYDIDVYIKDKLPEHVDIDFVLKYIIKAIPPYMFSGIDVIYIGQFDFLKQRDVNALYRDGAIYITNEQDDDRDMIDDIIHEISHSVEDNFKDIIYADGRIMREFLGKRKKLYYLLKAEGLSPSETIQTEVAYNVDIDNYFYKTVGYPTLRSLINGLFLSPYSCTSLREYFATAFEEYFMIDRKTVKMTCPSVYEKIEELQNLEA